MTLTLHTDIYIIYTHTGLSLSGRSSITADGSDSTDSVLSLTFNKCTGNTHTYTHLFVLLFMCVGHGLRQFCPLCVCTSFLCVSELYVCLNWLIWTKDYEQYENSPETQHERQKQTFRQNDGLKCDEASKSVWRRQAGECDASLPQFLLTNRKCFFFCIPERTCRSLLEMFSFTKQ